MKTIAGLFLALILILTHAMPAQAGPARTPEEAIQALCRIDVTYGAVIIVDKPYFRGKIVFMGNQAALGNDKLSNSGTGFFISSDGLMLTANHVIGMNNICAYLIEELPPLLLESELDRIFVDIDVYTQAGKRYTGRLWLELNDDSNIGSKMPVVKKETRPDSQVKLLSYDNYMDMAVIKVDINDVKYLEIGKIDSVNKRDGCIGLGIAYPKSVYIYPGSVKSVQSIYYHGQKEKYLLNIYPAANGGSSGGPIISGSNMQVIGLYIMTIKSMHENSMVAKDYYSVAVPVNQIKKVLGRIKAQEGG